MRGRDLGDSEYRLTNIDPAGGGGGEEVRVFLVVFRLAVHLATAQFATNCNGTA